MPGTRLSLKVAVALALLVALACVVAGARLSLLRTVELRLVDARLRVPHDAPAVDRLLIVGIDQSTLSQLRRYGPGALARAEYAPVLRHLASHGASVIALDIYFGDAPEQEAGTRELAAALRAAGTVLLVAHADPKLHPSGELLEFSPPTQQLAQEAAAVVSPLLFRPDNIVRWVIPFQRAGEQTAYPALAVAVAQRVGAPALPQGLTASEVPVFINWAGPAGTVPRVRFEDVYYDRVPAEKIAGRAVLIGVVDEEEDLLGTPVGPMAGVECHAQAAATLLSGKLITPPSHLLGLLLGLAACTALALAGVGRGQWLVWLMTGGLLAMWGAVALWAFRAHLVMLPITPVALSIIVCGLTLSALQSQRAIASLSRLWPTWVKTQGEELEATVLVCDLAGYTARAEQIPPAELMALMRRVFAAVDEVVAPRGGVAARRPGDAALVFFRPLPDREHHTMRALEAACALAARLEQELGGEGLDFGITLTTGLVSLGWVGEAPPEPQILGDPVNVAFRLQRECRERACRIIADWPTASAHPAVSALMQPLGQVQVRNRRQPVQLFTLRPGSTGAGN